MNQKSVDKAVSIITQKLLTPLLYKLEDEISIRFIGFFDTNMDIGEITATEEAVSAYVDFPLEIIDIREFEISDILNIIETAELVYSMNPVMESFFGSAIANELEMYKQVKQSYVERKNTTGTLYIQ